jgi:hypothetical protein
MMKRSSPALSHDQRHHIISHPVRKSARPATAVITPNRYNEEEEDDEDKNQAETKRICRGSNPPPPPSRPYLQLQRSAGRSREWLNEPQNLSRLEALGIFARFGVSSFATSQNVISHLVFNSDWNKLATRSDETLTLYVGAGPSRAKRAQTLAGMTSAVPVFFDYKQLDHAIHYVGHWKPIPASAVEFSEVRNVQGKDRCMKIDLAFERFDDDFSSVMDG